MAQGDVFRAVFRPCPRSRPCDRLIVGSKSYRREAGCTGHRAKVKTYVPESPRLPAELRVSVPGRNEWGARELPRARIEARMPHVHMAGIPEVAPVLRCHKLPQFDVVDAASDGPSTLAKSFVDWQIGRPGIPDGSSQHECGMKE